ncbi:hypothetical protein TWF481_002198 [Arthrobotrys musiformis]|uniref:Bacteriophage T5 Orf172 DNA-binding domain-containing protein n=1 Tax=Arthrobotrys musiformis TaxID=47236 RepID=A0AAV9VUH9_9PEZI
MPYIASTPEALSARLGRTDSLDPATTCRGISISSGKPCRRNITAKAPAGKKSTASSGSGSGNGGQPNPAEAFFCWQHKDQAADTVVLHRTDSQKKRRLQGRTSFDSLVEVILGPEAANSEAGPGKTQLLIRRETRLNNDEVMVVSQSTMVKKDSKMVKNAKKPGESQGAIWDALHNQQNGAAQGSNGQVPYGADANGHVQYPQGPQANGQYQQYQHPGTHGVSQVQQQYAPHRPPAPAMGRIDEAPGDTYPPNNELKPPPPRPQSHRPKRHSLLAQLFCCLSLQDNNDTPPPRPYVPAQQQQQQQQQHHVPPQMQSVRPPHQPPPPINTTPYQSNYQAVPQQQVQQTPSGPSGHHPPHLKFDAPIRPEYPPNIHVHNGWDKTPYPPNLDDNDDDELSSSSADEDSDGDDAESIALPDEAVNSISPTLPLHLSAKTRTKITSEMRKPISQKDMPGYIYIFWLKDDTSAPLPVPASAPPTVSSFNIPPLPNSNSNGFLKPRKNSYIKDPGSAALFRVVEDPYDDDDDDESGAISPTSNRRSRGASISAAPSSPGGNKPGEKRVLLKIGRAQNVQRRLHQWSQQCGYNLQLLRYYPYVSLQDAPSSVSLKGGSPPPGTPGLSVSIPKTPLSGKQPSSPPASLGAKKVPFSHRVERLIHLELRDDYYNKPHVCETCQTVHKEWFAVPGTRDGVKRVDEVIKRWCKWAESLEGAVNNREQGGVSVGLGHRRGDSNASASMSAQKFKDERTVTGGVRGVESMQWTEGYESPDGHDADSAEERAKRQTRVDRMGTFGFL